MQSFGLWYKLKKDESAENIDFSAHVNFWFLEDINTVDKKIKTPYIDIGLKIKDYQKVEKITLHCPFSLSESNIEDLSPKMSKKNNATIIFNDDCEIETINSYTCVKFRQEQKNTEEDKEKKLLIFLMDQILEGTYRIEDFDDKSNIIFDFSNFHKYLGSNEQLNTIEDLYIRFRIKNVKLEDKIYFDSEPLNKSFESAFSGTRVLDFKINEKRNIDERLQVKMIVEEYKWAEFSKIHFLVMEPSAYDLVSFSNFEMSCRELEKGLWDDYLDVKINLKKGRVLAYHWRACGSRDKRIKDFSCLAKINYSKMRHLTLTSYIVMAIALGVLGNAVATRVGDFSILGKTECMRQMVGGALIFCVGWLLGKK